jgi:hypothetical protein
VPEALREADADDELHHDEGSVAVLAGVVDPDDVGVRHQRRRPGLLLEAVAKCRVKGIPGVQQLQSDWATEALVKASIDLGHPAAADQGFDPIAPSEKLTSFQLAVAALVLHRLSALLEGVGLLLAHLGDTH